MKTILWLALNVLPTIVQLTLSLKVEETRVRVVNWLLLAAWFLLIFSMVFPNGPWYFFEVKLCEILRACENHAYHLGNMVFWGATIPLILLLILISGHTVWRRICPLAFVAQVTRHLDWQRRRRRPDGVLEIPRIDANSFLGRHHVRLQWFLLIVGLSLRLLLINSNPFFLAMTLLATLLAAVLVGWLWGGKAWCQYFCPMGPVEAILVGPALGSSIAVTESKNSLPQSICRTIGPGDRVKSACVNCQSPCIDIDAERSYWYSQISLKGFDVAWWSYPGLVLSFFLILQSLAPGDRLYVSRAHWATDTSLENHILSNFHVISNLFNMPRLLAIPFLLVLGAFASFLGVFFLYRHCNLSQHRCRLLATYLALNIFFTFADPSLGVSGSMTTWAIRFLVLALSSRSLIRGWGRDRDAYLYEKALLSFNRHVLRHHLSVTSIRLVPQWSKQRQLASLKIMLNEIAQKVDQVMLEKLFHLVLNDLVKEAKIERAEARQVIQLLRDVVGLTNQSGHNVFSDTA